MSSVAGTKDRKFVKIKAMKQRTIIPLELTQNQLAHFAVLCGALAEDSKESIKDLKFPREFREIFASKLTSVKDVTLFESANRREEISARPSEFLRSVWLFSKRKL